MEKALDYVGGRKFILSVILIAVGTIIELKTDRGVSTSFAGLLVGILGTFSAANAFVTKSMGSESGVVPPSSPDSGAASEEIKSAIEGIASQVAKANELSVNIGQSIANQNKILAAMMQKQ